MSKHDICLIVAVGSEYAMKGINALNFTGVKYSTYPVSLLKLKKILPPPHQVPVLCYDDVVVPDTTDIMKFLDTKVDSFKLFPPPSDPLSNLVTSIEDEIDSLLSPYLRYYSLYDDAGFERCLAPRIRKAFPWGFQWTMPFVLRKTRLERLEILRKAAPNVNVDDPAAVRRGLHDLLAKYENMLPTGSEDTSATDTSAAPYICGTPQPSAADAGLYAMLERFVSTSGDAKFPPCLPDAIDDFPRLQAYVKRMETRYPVEFAGANRRPREAPRPIALVSDS